jgi:hypothetical protein
MGKQIQQEGNVRLESVEDLDMNLTNSKDLKEKELLSIAMSSYYFLYR